MIVHMCEQRSPEWYAARAGRFTASESGPFLINSGKVAEGARQKLIDRKLAEWAGEVEETYQSDDMKRGNALESIARDQYRRMMGGSFAEVGFISHNSLPIGCSPDDLVLSRDMDAEENGSGIPSLIIGGCEIKGPQGRTQIKYLREGVLPTEYEYQVHHCMAVTGAAWWDFFSFTPRVIKWRKERHAWYCEQWEAGKIPSFYIRTYRDAFTEQLSRALEDISHEFLRQRAWLENLNAA